MEAAVKRQPAAGPPQPGDTHGGQPHLADGLKAVAHNGLDLRQDGLLQCDVPTCFGLEVTGGGTMGVKPRGTPGRRTVWAFKRKGETLERAIAACSTSSPPHLSKASKNISFPSSYAPKLADCASCVGRTEGGAGRR
jgi:hypothetical protein